MKGRKATVARSAILVVAARWSDRMIGIVSTMILARLLVPADFGVMAMAMLVIGLVDVFLDLGVNIALIQKVAPTQAHYDAAWTLRLAQTALATSIVFACAPLAASYFNDAKIAPVLQVLAFSLVLSGCENIGVITFQKEMLFDRDFKYMLSQRVAGFFVTIAMAWFLRSYWALVVGSLSARFFGVVLSYVMHPMRPRLSFAKVGDIFRVSQWALVRGIGGFVEQNLHRWVVAERESAAVLGIYTLGGEIAVLPSQSLLLPLNRVLFPAFVRTKSNLDELKRVFLLAQSVQALIGIPAAVGVMLVAQEAVQLFLGDKWLAAVPFVRLMSVGAIAAALVNAGGYLLTALGHLKGLAMLSWFRVALFAALVYLVFPDGGALTIAWIRAVFMLMVIGMFFGWIGRVLPDVKMRQVADGLFRPLFGATVMTGCILLAAQFVHLPPLPLLVIKVVVGIAAYSGTVLLLWWHRGRPPGAEAYLLEAARHLRKPSST